MWQPSENTGKIEKHWPERNGCSSKDLMKGPAHKHRYDSRRTWECPACQRRLCTSGQVVHMVCDCRAKNEPGQQTAMRLLDEPLKKWWLFKKID